MQTGLLPDTAGSIIKLNYGQTPGNESWATLVPDTWHHRTQTFSGLIWCSPSSSEVGEVGIWPVPAKKLRDSKIVYTGPAPTLTGKRPLRRPGSIALLNGIVYTYCAEGLGNGLLWGAVWLSTSGGSEPEHIERHGTELVAGLL